MKNNRITLLLAIGVVVLMSACATKAKTASGPEPTKSVEQTSQETPKEAEPPAAAPAEESAPPAVAAEEVSRSAPAEEAAPAPAAEPEPVAAAPEPEPEPQPAAPAPEPAPAAETQKGIDLSTFEIVHFKFDKYDILPEYRDALAKEAGILKSSGAKIVIQGHCDERGTEEYNMALGDRRANAVKKYWVSLGVDEKQLGTISYGEERPVDTGHNRKAWKMNRRAQFSLAE